MATRALDVIAIGEALVEFNQTEPSQPHYVQGFGGDTSNTIIAVARSGGRAGYVTRVGNDQFGDMLMALWRREGIDVRGVAVDPEAPTGLYFVSHGPTGHSFSYRRAGSAASRLTPDEVPLELIAESPSHQGLFGIMGVEACYYCGEVLCELQTDHSIISFHSVTGW